MTRILSLCFLILFCSTTLAFGQKADSKKTPAKQASVLAKDARVPDGFVVVAMTATSKTIKKPAEQETICDGSPVPDGYSVIEITRAELCLAASENPLTSGMLIAREGATTVQSSDRRPRTSTANNDSDSDATVSRRRPKTTDDIIEERAERENLRAEEALIKRLEKKEIEDCIRQGKVKIGMTREEAVRAWGNPTEINDTFSTRGKRQQWVYNRRGYIYFNEAGVLYSIQSW